MTGDRSPEAIIRTLACAHVQSSAPRERILAEAVALFYTHGIRAAGIDLLIGRAGVAKATFYRHFPSKEALVVTWLQAPDTRWFDEIRATVETDGRAPGDAVSRLFAAVAAWLEAGDYTGCPYLAAAVEASDGFDRPSSAAARAYLEEIRAYLESLALAAGHAEPLRASRQLQASLAGAITLGVAHRTSRYASAAGEVAEGLLVGPIAGSSP